MKLVSMAKKAEEKGGGESMPPYCSDDAKYPYGTQISLGDDQLEALGISDLPKVGTVVNIQASTKVVSVRSEEDQEGTSDNSLTLQITDLGVVYKMTAGEAASTLFGDSKKGGEE